MYLVNNALSQLLQSQYPFWQAPLPFDLIQVETSGKITAHGGHGIIRIAPHDTRSSLVNKTNLYRKHADTPSYCFTHLLPQQPQGDLPDALAAGILQNRLRIEPFTAHRGDHFLDLLDTAIAANPRAIGFAQGLPDRETLSLIREKNILTFAIVGNLLEALTADDFGIDVLVLQGMEAGGERAAFSNHLPYIQQPALSLLQQVRGRTTKPLVLWGDLVSAADIVAAIISGAQAVMLDRPFVACTENDLEPDIRQQAINANEYESEISTQFTVRPLRCLRNPFSKKPEDLLQGQEALFAAAFDKKPEARPLTLSLSAIEDPLHLAHYFTYQAQHIRQMVA
ncbi:MAG: nitronate monooxygenase [Cardiobacteriaceae bacterium]|nr:nitronate monooxygenase [Cardiobacteriaceae bacterium]